MFQSKIIQIRKRTEFRQIDYLYTLNPPDGKFYKASLPVGEGLEGIIQQ